MRAEAADPAGRFGADVSAGWSGAGEPRWPRRVAVTAGSMMLGGAALNTVLVTVKPEVYSALGDWFADLSPWQLSVLNDVWDKTLGEHPRVWGAAVGIGYEAAVGVLALSHNPRHRLAGLGGIALFKGGLLAMGLWSWAVPWLAVLLPTIAATARAGAATPAPGGQPAAPRSLDPRRSA